MEIGSIGDPQKFHLSGIDGSDPHTCGTGGYENRFSGVDRLFKHSISKGDENKGFLGTIWEKVKSSISYIWEGIKSFFSCSCFKYFSSKPVERNAQLITYCSELDRLKIDFENKSKDAVKTQAKREEFGAWWKEQFNTLDPQLKKEIILEDLRSTVAVSKLNNLDEQSPEKEIQDYAEKLYNIKGDDYNKTINFIVKLETAWDSAGKMYDPLDKNQLPRILQQTREVLTKRIKEQTNSSV